MIKHIQSTNTILLIRPKSFGHNINCQRLNFFQKLDKSMSESLLQKTAIQEFNHFQVMLEKIGVNTIVINDDSDVKLESAIYPNNWFSTHSNGDIYIYPMMHKSRRLEKHSEALSYLAKNFKVHKQFDLSLNQEQSKFLEGTGSMVFDRVHKIAYAAISERTNEHLFHDFCKQINYRAITMNPVDKNSNTIYHTNVMLSITNDLAIICLDSIPDEDERLQLLEVLEETKKTIINVSIDQMNNFCCNVLEVIGNNNQKYLIMSDTAFRAFSDQQKIMIERFLKISHCDLSTIEAAGGGGARCMMAEIFL